MNNNHLFNKKGKPRTPRTTSDRRAAIARAAMAPRDLSPLPPGAHAELRAAWVAFCQQNNERPERVDTALIGRIRIAVRGALTSLRRGDIVLVWDNNPRARAPLYTVWHPRNPILTCIAKENLVLLPLKGTP